MKMIWLFVIAGALFAQNPCDDPNTRTAICQGGDLHPPKEIPMLNGEVEAVLEDGGKPPARPDFVYSRACYGSLSEPAQGVCRVQVILKGFRQIVVTPNTRSRTVVVLQRLRAEGDAFPKNVVNVAALAMPPAAHKAYAKGQEAMGLRKYPEAEKWFRLAVKEFHGHALAWDELGVMLNGFEKFEEARAAFEHAASADPRFARPIVHLAGMEIMRKRWEDAVALTARALALRPTNYPRAYAYDALVNFNLKRLAKAEESALETIRLDTTHRFAIAEYLLGSILAGKGDPAGASDHLNAYLKLSPQDRFAVDARRLLTTLER